MRWHASYYSTENFFRFCFVYTDAEISTNDDLCSSCMQCFAPRYSTCTYNGTVSIAPWVQWVHAQCHGLADPHLSRPLPGSRHLSGLAASALPGLLQAGACPHPHGHVLTRQHSRACGTCNHAIIEPVVSAGTCLHEGCNAKHNTQQSGRVSSTLSSVFWAHNMSPEEKRHLLSASFSGEEYTLSSESFPLKCLLGSRS